MRICGRVLLTRTRGWLEHSIRACICREHCGVGWPKHEQHPAGNSSAEFVHLLGLHQQHHRIQLTGATRPPTVFSSGPHCTHSYSVFKGVPLRQSRLHSRGEASVPQHTSHPVFRNKKNCHPAHQTRKRWAAKTERRRPHHPQARRRSGQLPGCRISPC